MIPKKHHMNPTHFEIWTCTQKTHTPGRLRKGSLTIHDGPQLKPVICKHFLNVKDANKEGEDPTLSVVLGPAKEKPNIMIQRMGCNTGSEEIWFCHRLAA